jgi:2-keto-3-deoxy-L-rhamnonate aldolase RhmA
MQLIYITNQSNVAQIVQEAGVDLVMVDLEINGKEERQGHLNTVISRHIPEDISKIRAVLDKASLLVRLNPMYDKTQEEVDDALARGADQLMLPMFTSADEVAKFVEIVGGRAGVVPLLETPAAFARMPDILGVAGITRLHFGLNDLHLALGLKFMFEVMSGGLMDHAARLCRDHKQSFGIGGVAPLGQGFLPAERILTEHMRLGSRQVILSRAFGDLFDTADPLSAWRAAISNLRAFLARDNHDLAESPAAFRLAVKAVLHAKDASG